MTDDEERLRQHWQELAEQLGIEDSPPEEKVVAKKPRTAAGAIGTRPAADEDASEVESTKEELTLPSKSQIPGGPPAFEEPATGDTEERPQEPPIQSPSSPAEVTPERRRGGRSRTKSRRSSEPSPPRERQKSRHSEEVAEEDSAKRGRRRRREPPPEQRTREEEVSAPAQVEPEEAPAVAEAGKEEADKDDLDTLTDWNVPSWTELIDSLYRPDR